MTIVRPPYSRHEERLHALSHGAGVFLSVIALTWMLHQSVLMSDPVRVAASLVYGFSLIALFLSSTLYHALHDSPRRSLLKLLDHCAIYLLIAGTYTPFLLIAMPERSGWWLFGTIWMLATVGIVSKLCFRHRFPRLSLAGYLLMGWLVVIAGPNLANAVGADGMRWLLAGGLSYTLGAVFYAAKRMTYHHAIWHVFVLAGGICHFVAVALYVLPDAAG